MKPLLRSFRFAALALLLAAGPAGAACIYNALTSDVTATASSTPTLYTFAQSSPYWSAVAVRPQAGEDWDVTVYGATAPDPACLATPLGSSTGGAGVLDFVVGDFNYDPLGTYYASVTRFTGTQSAAVQWDDGPDQLVVNGAAVTQNMAASDLIRVYDVPLVSGTTYTFDFYPRSGLGAHLLLFRNALGGTCWAGRSSAQFDVTGPTTFTAPATGYYGVVVTSDGGNAFTYSLGVTASSCPIATVLSPGASVVVAPNSGNLAFEANNDFWMGVAVRAVSGDWDAQLFGLPTGGTYPTCFSSLLASSTSSPGLADITIGDFSHSPFGWYFAYPYLFSGSAGSQVQFTGTSGYLSVNNGPISGSLAATDVAQVQDVYLNAGRTYALTFQPSAAGVTLLVFANPGGGVYFAGRAAAALATTTSTTYTAPADGWYGLAVMNDAGIAASYTLGAGDCGLVTALVNDVAAPAGSRNDYYSFNQQVGFWTAVAVRNSLGADWDLVVNQDNVAAPAPDCATTPLAGSSYVLPIQDFVVGDFNTNALGTYYVHARQFTAGGVSPAQVEWDSGPDMLLTNDNNAAIRVTGSSDLIGCWDVYLTAGQTYEFDLSHAGGADLKLLLFHNPGGTYWSGRGGAEFSTTGSQTYTAPTSGFYGVVVMNDNGAGDTYAVRVLTCDPLVAIPAEPATGTTSFSGVLNGTFTEVSDYWTPVAARATSALDDWDVNAYSSPSGGPIGSCLSGPLAGSSWGAGFTDFVVGDFNFLTPGTCYAGMRRFSGTGTATTQYFPGAQVLGVGAAPQVRTKPGSFLVESWDALLTAGQTYSVRLSHDPAFRVKVAVFPSTGAAFWGGRGNALLETATTATFVAPTTGFCGLVVVNDGGSGSFDLSIKSGVAAVDGAPPPEQDALRGISPNPGRSGLHLDYALHEGGTVAFEILDMAGRRVSTFSPPEKGAGSWSVAWAAADDAGRPLRPGLYFVRMRIGDRTVGTRKVALLE